MVTCSSAAAVFYYFPLIHAHLNNQDSRIMEKRTRSYVREAARQIMEKPLVEDVIILNRYGDPVETSLDMGRALQVTGLFESLRVKVEAALNILDPRNELVMLRVRSRKNETILTPDGSISVLVIQKPKDCFHK